MVLNPLTMEEIYSIIIKFSKKNSAGGMILINHLFNEGVFPSAFKHAIIKSVNNKNEKEKIGNYRAIALLPAF